MRLTLVSLSLASALALVAAPAFAQTATFGAVVTPNCGCTAPKLPSEIFVTIQDDENDVPIGTQEKIQAVVQPTQGGPQPTGEVDFYYGTYNFASADLKNNEADVVLDTRHVPPGKISIYAVYRGDSNYQGSTSAVETFGLVGTPNSQTSLAVSPSSVHQGGSVTFTADVQPRTGGPSPTGYVMFFSTYQNTYLGSAKVSGTVAAETVSTAGIPYGKYGIYAVYTGDSTYVASSSNVGYVSVTK